MDNCNAEKGKNQVFDPFVNTGVAVMLDSERKKICGIMGGDSSEDTECGVDLARCPYCVLIDGSSSSSDCALKFVARVMRGWSPKELAELPSEDKEAENEQI